MKKGILVISFGTTYQDTREKNIDAVAKAVEKEFPDLPVWQAFSSPTVRRILRERDGISYDSLSEALEKMKKAGMEKVYILPTHLINGFESDKIRQEAEQNSQQFQELLLAPVLLNCEADHVQVAEALWQGIQSELEEQGEDAIKLPVIFMGHGTAHQADASYDRMTIELRKAAQRQQIHIATVEGKNTIDTVIRDLQAQGITAGKVVLTPFMLVAGDHAVNDMMGREDSMAAKLRASGYEPLILLRGIGEYPEIRRIYCEHLKGCM